MTEAERIEAEIKEYQRKKKKEYKKAWLAAHPDYYQKKRQRQRMNNPQMVKAAEKRRQEYKRQQLLVQPMDVNADIKEWQKRRCLTDQQMADLLSVSIWQYQTQKRHSRPVTEKLLELCGLKYDKSRPQKYTPKYGGMAVKSICSDCKSLQCSWLERHVPVDGWKAKRVRWGSRDWTYCVMGCPYYED